MTAEDRRPFRINVADSELAELRERLDRVRWAPEPPDGDGGYGEPRAGVQDLVERWRDRYDWRVWEARLNRYSQFTTTVDGTNVHFLHVRSPEPDALPLILSHGWPGSVAEFLDVLEPLSDPRGHGLDPAVAFHLVIPSLPGFGWSGPTADTGWGTRRIARAWAILMRRLGYDRYGAAGNDWGSRITPELGRVAPDAVVGVHVTQIFSFPVGESMAYPPFRQARPDSADTGGPGGVGRAAFPATEPGLVLSRPFSAAADAGVRAERLPGWPARLEPPGDARPRPDVLLTHVSIHWFTGTAGSALRLCADQERQRKPQGPTTVPLGLAQFPNDFKPLRVDAERDHANIVSWNTYERGGHYAAHQAPDLLVDDMRRFFARVPR